MVSWTRCDLSAISKLINLEARRDQGGRLLPDHEHPGAPVVHKLSEEEEQEWRRWTPKTGDPVLVELSDDSIWPGKASDPATLENTRLT